MNDVVPISGEFALLEKALERNLDADQLGKLVELCRKMKEDKSKQEFSHALNLCQTEMPGIVKDAENKQKGSRYVLLETVQRCITPVYTKHGFSIAWSQGEAPREGYTRVLATLFHNGGWSKDFQGDYPIDGKGAKGGEVMNALQGTVSSHTYAQRDMLRLMFNLTIAGNDVDGQLAETIDEEQEAKIAAGLAKCKEIGHPIDEPRFKAWLEIKEWSEMRKNQFEIALTELRTQYAAGIKQNEKSKK